MNATLTNMVATVDLITGSLDIGASSMLQTVLLYVSPQVGIGITVFLAALAGILKFRGRKLRRE